MRTYDDIYKELSAQFDSEYRVRNAAADIYIEERFPNGFTSWYETFFEVVSDITIALTSSTPPYRIDCTQNKQGHGGLYELAKELTDKFETKNKGVMWDGEFFDSIYKFLDKELYNKR